MLRALACLAPLLATACGECTPLAEMDVRDRTGDDRGDLVADVEGALSDFATWTGRETVCVTGIDVVRDQVGSGDHAGLYRGPHLRIDVLASDEWDLQPVARHELCHALDAHEDDLALRREDAFADPERLLPADASCEGEQCIREAFAHTCAVGPWDTRLDDVHEEVCGIEVLEPWDRVVQHEVYTAHRASLPPIEVVPQASDPTLLDRTYQPGPEGVLGERLLLVDAGAGELLVVDLDDPAVYESYPLPGGGDAEWAILSGRDGALLALHGSPPRAWRLDPVAGVGDEVDLQLELPETERPELGWLDGDTLHVQFRDEASGETRFRVLDLATGQATDVALGFSASALWPADDGLFLFVEGDIAADRLPSFVRGDPLGGSLVRTDLPWQPIHAACPMPDGRVTVLFYKPRVGVGVLDPAVDRWQIDEPTCDVEVMYWPRLLLAGDTPARVRYIPAGEGLSRVEVTRLAWSGR